LTFAGFDGVKVYALPKVLHEFGEQDKGKELAFGVFKSPPLVNAKDVEVNPLHVIFDLKEVLVGKDCFKTNHLLPLAFNLAPGPTLMGKIV